MKVVVAIDSFKGSLSSMEAGLAAREGILRARPDACVIVKPLADGGEGTADALIDGLGGERVYACVMGPQQDLVTASYGMLGGGKAVMEMASAAGITLTDIRDPMTASTYGVGELMLHAMRRGARSFIIGIGGSATNDGGLGMLKALGWSFSDKDGEDVGMGGQALGRIASITGPEPERRALLEQCTFEVACDVKNPLCGSDGATYIYGPQKGASPEMLECLENGMKNFADVCAEKTGEDLRGIAGAGAAGGLGFALVSFLGAELVPGVELVLEASGIDKDLEDADILVTGEGRLDAQTSMGKAPAGAAALAKKYGARVIAFAGSVTRDATVCNSAGIDAFFPIIRNICTLEEAMDKTAAYSNLADTAEQVFRLLT